MSAVGVVSIPLVSIGLPVYNGGDYISEAIDSLLSQDYSNFEILISDNASTDATEEICRSYVAKDPRVKYLRQSVNLGPAKNFLFVLHQAVGKYFMWAAHDDIWAPNWISILIGGFQDNDLSVRGKVTAISENGKRYAEIPVRTAPAHSYIRLFMEDERLGRAFHIYGLFKRSSLMKADFAILESGRHSTDIYFVSHLSRFGNMRVMEQTCQYYRLRKDSTGARESKASQCFGRVIFAVYPLDFYVGHIKASPFPYSVAIAVLAPIKHLKSQAELWVRGLRRKFLNREFI